MSFVQTSSESALLIKFCGYPLSIRCFLNFVMFSSNVFIEEFVLSSLRASPFTKPFFTPGW